MPAGAPQGEAHHENQETSHSTITTTEGLSKRATEPGRGFFGPCPFTACGRVDRAPPRR